MNSKTQICVIDFETLGTNIETAPLLALGIVIGDAKGKIQSEKEFIFNLPNQLANKDKLIEEAVLHWWTKPERANLFAKYMHKCSISQVIQDETFSEIHSFLMNELIWNDKLILAAYHDSFDTGLLKQLYKDYCWLNKWNFSYRAEFDLATLSKIAKAKPSYLEQPFIGTKHKALYDARNEYTRMLAQLKFLGIEL